MIIITRLRCTLCQCTSNTWGAKGCKEIETWIQIKSFWNGEEMVEIFHPSIHRYLYRSSFKGRAWAGANQILKYTSGVSAAWTRTEASAMYWVDQAEPCLFRSDAANSEHRDKQEPDRSHLLSIGISQQILFKKWDSAQTNPPGTVNYTHISSCAERRRSASTWTGPKHLLFDAAFLANLGKQAVNKTLIYYHRVIFTSIEYGATLAFVQWVESHFKWCLSR